MSDAYKIEVLNRRMNIIEKILGNNNTFDPASSNILSDILLELKEINKTINSLTTKMDNLSVSYSSNVGPVESVKIPSNITKTMEIEDKQYIPDINIEKSKSQISSKKQITQTNMSEHMEAFNRLK